jgi:4-oxalomesaconate hydratase
VLHCEAMFWQRRNKLETSARPYPFTQPHLYAQPELCGFQPNTFVGITGVFERKLKAMEAMAAQKYMHKHYAERAEHRAFHARYATGDGEVRYAEAFQRGIPQVVRSL